MLGASGSVPVAEFRCLAKSEDFERKLRKRFLIPDIVIWSGGCNIDECPLLSKLPCEVLLEIFHAIGHAPSQVALALSCRRLAEIAKSVQLTLTSISAKYAGYLPPSVFDVPDLMVQLRSWMPVSLKLCGHCLTYRPSTADYWKSVPGYERNDFWIQKVGWSFKDARWWKQVHDICPMCHWDCTLSDYIDCDGCRALGRLGDVDFVRLSESTRSRVEDDLQLIIESHL